MAQPWEKYKTGPWDKHKQPEKPDIGPANTGLGRTVAEQGLQGATFGFSDEITSALAAPFVAAMTDMSIGEAYKGGQELSKRDITAQFEERPIVSTASNIAGGVGTGVTGAATKGGKVVSDVMRSGGPVSKLIKGALGGGTSAAAYGAGTAEGGERVEGAIESAPAGAVLGAAAPVVGKVVSKMIPKKKSPIPNADKMREQASRLYQNLDDQEAHLSPVFTNDYIEKTINKIESDPLIKKIKSKGGLKDVSEEYGEILIDYADEPMTLQRAEALDETLGKLAYKNVDIKGNVDETGRGYLSLQSDLRDMISSAGEDTITNKEAFDTWDQARKMWSQSRKMSDIERIMERAQRADNPASSIKNGFNTLLSNPKRMKGFTDAERKAIERAAESGIVTDTLRTFGSRFIPMGMVLAEGGLGPTSAALAATTASRGAASKMQTKKAADIARIIANKGEPVNSPIFNVPGSSVPTGDISNMLGQYLTTRPQ